VKTQWRPDKFVEQCAIIECEAWQLDFIIKDVSIQLGINRKNECTDISKFQPQGKFTASFGGMSGQSMMPVCIHWHNEKKNRMGFSVSDRFEICIQSLAERLGFKEKFQVTGYTTLKVYEIINCILNYNILLSVPQTRSSFFCTKEVQQRPEP
jgi:hypothetical protein